MRDYYRELSYADRCDARDRGEMDIVRQWDRDHESSERAYDNWMRGGDFRDSHSDERFS